MPHSRHPVRLLSACLMAALLVGCVSRNVERIPADEAATMSPPPAPATAEERAAAAELPGISGTVTLGPETGGAAPAGTLYLIVRVSGRQGGAPLAVKQLTADFPVAFRVTEADAMVPGTPLIGDMDIIVRLDQDGDAFSRQDGDLEASVGPVQVGDDIEVALRPAAGAGS